MILATIASLMVRFTILVLPLRMILIMMGMMMIVGTTMVVVAIEQVQNNVGGASSSTSSSSSYNYDSYSIRSIVLPIIVLFCTIIILIQSSLLSKYKKKNDHSSNNSNTNNNNILGVTSILYQTKQGNAYPYIGHAITFLLYTPWDLLTMWHRRHDEQQLQLQNQQQQEPIICFPLMNTYMFSIASSYYCKCILQHNASSNILQKDTDNTMKPFLSILGTGIVSSEGNLWLQQRLKMSHPLRIDILDIIPIQTLYAIQRLYTILDTACIHHEPIPIGSLLRHLTLQVISSSFLSLNHYESDSTFGKYYLPIVEECNKRVWYPYRTYLPFIPSFYQYHYNVYQLNTYVESLIRQRWKLRCYERKCTNTQSLEQQNDISTTTTSTTTTITGRKIDVLDKILQVYEKQQNDDVGSNNNNSHDTPLPESIVKQVRDEMKTFMLAGHETSAAVMTWTIYELLLSSSSSSSSESSSSMLDQVVQEANDIFDPNIDWKVATEQDLINCIHKINSNDGTSNESSKSIISMASLSHQLLYTEACLKESLRKYSVVPIVARRVVKDLYINKMESNNNNDQYYFFPKGSTILINIQAVHLDPTTWPNPMQYNPNRFVEYEQSSSSQPLDGNSSSSTKDTKNSQKTKMVPKLKTIEPYTFLPFIAGPRNCLGQHLALLETKMVIALLFQRYNFTLPSNFNHTTSSSIDPNATTSATSWRDPSIFDPRHRFMVPIIPKEEIMLSVSRK